MVGAISGNLLPVFVVSALSVAIYGMFLAVIIPPCKKNSAVLEVVVGAMAMSTLLSYLPLHRQISSSLIVIITTVMTAGIAAWLNPIQEKKEGTAGGE